MDFVVDANIIIAALIRDNHTRHLLLMSPHSLFSPAFLLEEIDKNSDEISSKSGVSKNELRDILHQLIAAGNITIVPTKEYKDTLPKATTISPDIKDAPYFALAIKLKCAIWSNDKKLKEQRTVKVYSTEEM